MKKLVGDVQVSEDHHVMLDDAARGTLENHFTLEKLEIVTSEPEEEVLRRPEDVQRDFMLELKQQHVFHGRGDVKRFLDGIKWLGGADGLSGSLLKGLEMAGARQGYFLGEGSESGSFFWGLSMVTKAEGKKVSCLAKLKAVLVEALGMDLVHSAPEWHGDPCRLQNGWCDVV